MLGLGLVLAALCSSGLKEQLHPVTQTLDKLLSNLQDSSGQGRMLQEVKEFHVVVEEEEFSRSLRLVFKSSPRVFRRCWLTPWPV